MADDNTKDLDFDELHKAVNALMDKAQKRRVKKLKASPRQDVQDKKVEHEEATAATPETAETYDEANDDRIAVNIKRPLPTLTSHKVSHGRAMDVVNPRDKPRHAPPSESVGRQAPTLQPTGRVVPEETPLIVPERAPLEDKPEEDSKELNEALASLGGEVPKVKEPEPIMTHQQENLPTLDEDNDEADTDEPEAPSEAPTQDASNGSPFITTKVEKRPLGAYADSVNSSKEQVEPAEEPGNPGEAEVTEKPEVDSTEPNAAVQERPEEVPNPLPIQPQPEELGPAVVAVESAESETSEAEDSSDSNGQDLRSMSIPQQYKESEVQQDEAPRPVFDTKEYYPAIEAHSSSHHGRASMWVIGILAFVMLVAVLGAIYYLVTGDLDFSALFGG